MHFAALVAKPERWSRLFGLATMMGAVCAMSGPYSTYTANGFNRVAYWMALFWIGPLIVWPIVSAGLAVGARHGFSARMAAGVAILLACVPLAAVAAAGGLLVWPLRASWMRPIEWYGQTVLIAAPIAAAAVWLELRLEAPATVPAPHSPATPPGATRDEPAATDAMAIPAHLLDMALCLQMEDHHVRIHGPYRSVLHLAAMRDVVRRMDGGRGLQVHRSWWVARDAVTGWAENGRQVSLTLANGLVVPVARNRIARLRAEGWLGADRAD